VREDGAYHHGECTHRIPCSEPRETMWKIRLVWIPIRPIIASGNYVVYEWKKRDKVKFNRQGMRIAPKFNKFRLARKRIMKPKFDKNIRLALDAKNHELSSRFHQRAWENIRVFVLPPHKDNNTIDINYSGQTKWLLTLLNVTRNPFNQPWQDLLRG